ncbi:zinc finger CCHC domain-containing protein 7-like [Canis lupus familiaris]|uniref:zinc finger CCHC domain-containing protein 7-like n=1 Tax=Canis lupus familiaris TaxID=9615 RepID=UPI0018F67784|nr:zinc finger CCHC domain-containing protein 7-like [Canis lupus familiaris]
MAATTYQLDNSRRQRREAARPPMPHKTDSRMILVSRASSNLRLAQRSANGQKPAAVESSLNSERKPSPASQCFVCILASERILRRPKILGSLEDTGYFRRGEDGVSWFISDKDAEAQIVNNRSSGRWTHRYYSANKNVTCRNCDKCGHLSKNCPLPQKVRPCCLCSERGHLQYACPARFCLGCSLPMSSTHRCLERSSWRKRCDRCDMIGHYADACPDIWRQYHLTKPRQKVVTGSSRQIFFNVISNNLQECTERRMFNQTFPTSPFIFYYDDKYEIREREQRIKRKVKELQKNGDFPRQFKRPHMEAADKRPHQHRRKSHASCRNNRWPQEKKETQKEMSRSNKEREKHRKADRCHDLDEDFPRGPKLHSSSGTFRTQKAPKSFHHSSHSHKPREDKLPREGKRSKHKKKSHLEGDGNDNLFLIKQRKKKSKL